MRTLYALLVGIILIADASFAQTGWKQGQGFVESTEAVGKF